jgi:hypothetical protein
MEFEPLTGNIARIAAVCEVLKVSGERKERWLYLRAALSSTINYTEYLQFIQPNLVVLRIHYKCYL